MQVPKVLVSRRSSNKRAPIGDSEAHLISATKDRLAPNSIWRLRGSTESLLRSTLDRLPGGKVSESEQRYPTTLQGVRAFLDSLFARHFFQVQDSLLAFVLHLVASQPMEHGTVCFADVGSGPAVASLALMDLLNCVQEIQEEHRAGRQRRIGISVALNDISEPCLNVGLDLLAAYSRAARSRLFLERIIPVSVPFPESNTQLRRIAQLTQPYDLCCLSYALAPLKDQSDCNAISQGISRLAEACRYANGRIVVIQDKFHESLLSQVCRNLGSVPQEVQIKQAVYDPQNQNTEHTYTFFRSIYPDSKKDEQAQNVEQVTVSA